MKFLTYMSEHTPASHKQAAELVGTTWQHRKKRGVYRITESRKDEVYLQARCGGCRSTWKWVGLLEHDYEMVDQ